MNRWLILCLMIALFLLPAGVCDAAVAQARENQRAEAWIKEHFAQPSAASAAVASPAGLTVIANHDPVQHNSRGRRPLKLGDKEYTRGLYCHAISEVVVNLPGPGKKFAAMVGVDDNPDTRRGASSVVFSVDVAGKQAFRSNIMRSKSPPAAVEVDLGGATSFVLHVGDAGDGINSDQADWADAKVTLADGKEIWVGDLPEAAGPGPGNEPFSFVYDGKFSGQLLPGWKQEIFPPRPLDDNRTARTVSWTDPATGLVVRCEAIEYRDFPVVEWTLHFKNAGTSDTPLLSQVRSTDIRLAGKAGSLVLHHAEGSPAGKTDYRPMTTQITPDPKSLHFAAAGGRPTNSQLPYFNVEQGDGGTIVVVGWPGQWSGDFVSESGGAAMRFAAGQEITHLVLHPGEEIRTPLSVLLFYQGDWLRGQNVFRRWMLEHNLPRGADGKVPTSLMLACSSHQFGEMINASEQNQEQFIDGYLHAGIKLDYWWMDAGWYPQTQGWTQVGTWEVDPRRFPNGLRTISDHAHEKGVKTIVWFEPERVAANTWITQNHPDWVWGGAGGGLLKLGDETVRKWLTDHVDQLITAQGIDLYRQDFNMDPLGAWRGADAPDRQGMTEIRHVEGYLAYWDELRRRHPGMLIDTCASGGRRNDLETLRRSLPLLRSDEIMEPVGQQNHTYGISLWIPFSGTGIGENADPYLLRSQMAPSNTGCWDVRDAHLDYAAIRKLLDERLSIAPLRMGDYYPLTEYGPGEDVWIAWQFDRPEQKDGMVEAFRRPRAADATLTIKPHNLDPAATYQLHDLDQEQLTQRRGAELMDAGITIKADKCPAAIIITYKRMP